MIQICKKASITYYLLTNNRGKRFKWLKKDTWNCLPRSCNPLVVLSIHLGTTQEYLMLRDMISDSLKSNLGNWDKSQEELDI